MESLFLGSVTPIIPTGIYERSLEIYLVQTPSNTVTKRLEIWDNHILIVLAIFFGSLSIASSILTFYWFFRMRRSFRHDLIMLLINSDMFKAIWAMTYPIVFISSGQMQNQSAICQIAGFFLSVSMVQSDIAILIIAVHSALCIFKNTQFKTVEGLYPYRRVAYIFWCTVPISISSLAFVGSRRPYITDGPFCCFLIHPFWYREALGWVPRYFVFLFTLGTYCSIYFYARKRLNGSSQNLMEIPRLHMSNSDPQSLPQISRGFKPGYSSSSRNEMNEIRSISKSNQSKHPSLNSAYFMTAKILAQVDENSSINNTRSIEVHSCKESIPRFQSPIQSSISLSTSHQSSIISETSADVVKASCSRLGMFMCRSSSTSEQPPIQPRSNVQSTKASLTLPEMKNLSTLDPELWHPDLKKRLSMRTETIAKTEQTQRKLRSLFIYPMTYIVIWLIPFIIHLMQFNETYAVRTPFVLAGITTTSIILHAFVNCSLFLVREKPWRHIPAHDGSFWGSLKFWTCSDALKNLSKYKNWQRKTGKTREDMVSEARAAYQRRGDELAFQRSRLEKQESAVKQHNTERNWWDDCELG
ncbi:putative plasma membrane g protein coupled receptor [Golovinomyces cichoracearum]|uniref:Putative plasma membrane g protein coupled receptor n=1 Tax=Golovinomyces cichoracearum TaxID=62708 RepID=A0A420HMH3_9PEZI|nr:putative plasma membrane g protein coupled receptor [Golovinomyces cichoracearum]